MKRKTIVFISVLILTMLLLGLLAIGVAAADASKTGEAQTTAENVRTAEPTYKGILSPGMLVLARDVFMAKAATAGNDILFSDEDFKRALNVSSLGAIYIDELPPAAEGTLLLDGARVSAGQTVSGSKLDALTFDMQSEGVAKSGFTFITPTGCPVKCELYTVEKTNYSPTVSLITSTVSDVTTYVGIACAGRLGGYDPEGDAMVFDIVSYPENGVLFLDDRRTGAYTFIPASGFIGKDEFSYIVYDKYGNSSPAATVALTVARNSADIAFADMENDSRYNHAISVCAKGIMSGVAVGAENHFYPSGSVNRGEFLVMAMTAAGKLPISGESGFDDDENIPVSIKGYVAAAKKAGYVDGIIIDEKLCFLPDEEITRAEAAVIADRITKSGRGELPVASMSFSFTDSKDIPFWAEASVRAMNALGVIYTSSDGKILPDQKVDRGLTAEIIDAVMKLCGKQ